MDVCIETPQTLDLLGIEGPAESAAAEGADELERARFLAGRRRVTGQELREIGDRTLGNPLGRLLVLLELQTRDGSAGVGKQEPRALVGSESIGRLAGLSEQV